MFCGTSILLKITASFFLFEKSLICIHFWKNLIGYRIPGRVLPSVGILKILFFFEMPEGQVFVVWLTQNCVQTSCLFISLLRLRLEAGRIASFHTGFESLRRRVSNLSTGRLLHVSSTSGSLKLWPGTPEATGQYDLHVLVAPVTEGTCIWPLSFLSTVLSVPLGFHCST